MQHYRAHPDPAVLTAYNAQLDIRYGLSGGPTMTYAAPIPNLAGDMWRLNVDDGIHLPGDPTGPLRRPEYFTTLAPTDPLYLPFPAGSARLDWEPGLEGWEEQVINP